MVKISENSAMKQPKGKGRNPQGNKGNLTQFKQQKGRGAPFNPNIRKGNKNFNQANGGRKNFNKQFKVPEQEKPDSQSEDESDEEVMLKMDTQGAEAEAQVTSEEESGSEGEDDGSEEEAASGSDDEVEGEEDAESESEDEMDVSAPEQSESSQVEGGNLLPNSDQDKSRHTVYVGGMERGTKPAAIQKFFERYGKVERISVPRYKSAYYQDVFITFENLDDAKKAVKEVNGMEYKSSRISVRMKEVDKDELDPAKTILVSNTPKGNLRKLVLALEEAWGPVYACQHTLDRRDLFVLFSHANSKKLALQMKTTAVDDYIVQAHEINPAQMKELAEVLTGSKGQSPSTNPGNRRFGNRGPHNQHSKPRFPHRRSH